MSNQVVKISPSDLWRWDGKIDRGPYFILGLSLLIIKIFLDRWVSETFFHRSWSLLEYIAPGAGFAITALSQADRLFYLTMLLISLPFAWTGSVLTIRRLRGAQLPPWLVLFFYVPVVNLIFFKILTWVPSKSEEEVLELPEGEGGDRMALPAPEAPAPRIAQDAPGIRDVDKAHPQKHEGEVLPPVPESKEAPEAKALPAMPESRTTPTIPRRDDLPEPTRVSDSELPKSMQPAHAAGRSSLKWDKKQKFLDRIIPESDTGAMFISALLPVPIGGAICYLSTFILGSYGWGLFVALPFAVSVVAPLLYAHHQRRRLLECMQNACLSIFLLSCGLLLFRAEGIICLIMAAPIGLGIACLGGLLAYSIQGRVRETHQLPRIVSSIFILVAALSALDQRDPSGFPTYKVTTCIDIDAPPEKVWKHVVAFSSMGPPSDFLFKAGVAYPTYAKIHGHGPGAVRHCVFSTGTFVEPIHVWNEPNLLRFSVTSQPMPMRELSPYDIHPPHLNNYLVSKQGEFLLTETAGGGTRVAGTTWYQNRMSPGPYWQIWSDGIIHKIHGRVLDHVKALAEGKEQPARELTMSADEHR